MSNVKDFTIKNRGRRTSLDRFEKDLLSFGTLKIKREVSKNEMKNLENFIYSYLCSLDATHYTKSGRLQATVGRKRSAGDIFRLCKHYFPECTFKEVLIELNKLNFKRKKNFAVVSSVCPTIHKRVYRAQMFGTNGVYYSENYNDEFNLNLKKVKKLIEDENK